MVAWKSPPIRMVESLCVVEIKDCIHSMMSRYMASDDFELVWGMYAVMAIIGVPSCGEMRTALM